MKKDKIAAAACAALLTISPIGLALEQGDLSNYNSLSGMSPPKFTGDLINPLLQNNSIYPSLTDIYLGFDKEDRAQYAQKFWYGNETEKLDVVLSDKTPEGVYRGLKMGNYLENLASNPRTKSDTLTKIAESENEDGIRGILKNPLVAPDIIEIFRYDSDKMFDIYDRIYEMSSRSPGYELLNPEDRDSAAVLFAGMVLYDKNSSWEEKGTALNIVYFKKGSKTVRNVRYAMESGEESSIFSLLHSGS